MGAVPPKRRLGAARERVLAELRGAIVAGELRPGDRLVERDLADRFEVSRVPVREAIRALITEGFVVAETPRRLAVRRLTPADVEELFELREALEVYAAGLAAQRATPADITELNDILDHAARATAAQDAEKITELNTHFHERIVAMARNTLLAAALEPVEGRLRWLTRQNHAWPKLLAEHHELTDAIASGDTTRARTTAHAHVHANRLITLHTLFGSHHPRPANTPPLPNP
jgi:DNA-binding GntR family transcriptional regulator